MKKYLCCLVAMVLLVGCGVDPTSKPVEEPIPDLDTYLYEVKDDSENTLYLLGTLDFSPSILTIDGRFKEIYDQCDTIALEMCLTLDSSETEMYNNRTAQMPLGNFSGDHEFDAVWAAYSELIPYYTNSLIQKNVGYFHDKTMEVIGQLMKADANYGYILYDEYSMEQLLSTLATSDEKKIVELVGLEEMLDRYENITEVASSFVIASTLDYDRITSSMGTLVEAYINGTVDEEVIKKQSYDLFRLDIENVPEEYQTDAIKAQYEAYKEYKVETIDDETFKEIESLISQNDVLLGYDINYFLGENGLIKKLETAGYTVTKVE